MRVTLAVAIAASLAVGCGSAASAPGAPSGGGTSLTISYWPEGNDVRSTTDKPRQWTLRCDPAGGTHPADADACRKLKTLKQPFKRPQRGLMCTEQYGGPQEGTVRGTYLGTRVFASFSLVDGCQIARFKRVAFLFPGFRVGSLDS
jgi:Subtilisin inhibitor-like